MKVSPNVVFFIIMLFGFSVWITDTILELVVFHKETDLFIALFGNNIESNLIRIVAVVVLTILAFSIRGVFLREKEMQEMIQRRTDELSTLAHTLSHDVRGHLHVILTCCDVLRMNYQEVVLDDIVEHIRSIENLLSRSITLADAGKIVEITHQVNFEEIVEEATSIVPESITVTTENLPTVNCDVTKLTQALQNIVLNAILHGKATMITIRGESCLEKGDAIVISNNGVPIDKSIQERIFERGFTTDKKHTGLGLSIAAKIIQAHGWLLSLRVTNPTTFVISLS
ncbi:MAG: putative Histidine kinase [Candidatus Thorarchaeota archaeon]|nr:MAG: putative Histidine kinase [Candidatus Thorarchaeota archaeon]